MGSVKDLDTTSDKVGRFYIPPKIGAFGLGGWVVSGRFSVGDLKDLIPPVEIAQKAEALTMITAAFFEWLAGNDPTIKTCYRGIIDADGRVTDTAALLQRGDTSNVILMDLAHTPRTFSGGNLDSYRAAMQSGELLCGVADVESIFRYGFPLGSSTFEKMFKSIGMKEVYDNIATFDKTVEGLDKIRAMVAQQGLGAFSKLESVLQEAGLGTTVPNPGHILGKPVYNSTTKFEATGDRDIVTKEDERKLSGLDDEGYRLWAEVIFPKVALAQIIYCNERGVLNIDGKCEIVAYHKRPVVTDFACTPDENRLMITTEIGGEQWAIPSNKEIQRAIFRREGVYAAIGEAKAQAVKAGNPDNWRGYIPNILQQRGIDLQAVTEHSCNLMAYAIAEVANRLLSKTVFDTKPLTTWAPEFKPYASKVQMQTPHRR